MSDPNPPADQTPLVPDLSPDRRAAHERWLLELTAIPTATGHEHRVEAWIESWCNERDDVSVERDDAGNLTITSSRFARDADRRPLVITAHLDHPAFVVDTVDPDDADAPLRLAFRGGVMADYFNDARVTLVTADGDRLGATLKGVVEVAEDEKPPFKVYRAALDEPRRLGDVGEGAIAVWELPDAEIIEQDVVVRGNAEPARVIYTNACDDLAAAAAALAAFDELRALAAGGDERAGDVRLLFTLAEEVGFIGAIGACKHETIPRDARVIALENSRAFDDAPIGGGPIVRVGDRISVFDPRLTGAVAKVAETIAGGPAVPTASQKHSEGPRWRWQRKLMAGGACEASVFCSFGYESTCVCLPLGNYHNMAELDLVQAGTNPAPPRVGREHVALADYHGMVDLLIGCGLALETAPVFRDRIESLWTDKAFVLDRGT